MPVILIKPGRHGRDVRRPCVSSCLSVTIIASSSGVPIVVSEAHEHANNTTCATQVSGWALTSSYGISRLSGSRHARRCDWLRMGLRTFIESLTMTGAAECLLAHDARSEGARLRDVEGGRLEQAARFLTSSHETILDGRSFISLMPIRIIPMAAVLSGIMRLTWRPAMYGISPFVPRTHRQLLSTRNRVLRKRIGLSEEERRRVEEPGPFCSPGQET